MNDFSKSLLDFLESLGMKRKSISHCVIRDRALRNGTLENSSQCEEFEIERRDSERVVRTFRETHAISARSSSTNRIREKALRNESLDRSNAKDLVQVVRILREVDVVSAFSSSTTRQTSITQKSSHSELFSFYN